MGPIEGKCKRRLVSDINVTPLVDVMLVLLIIFMITAPMMTQGVDVDLPETTARPLQQEKAPLIITIDKKGAIFLNQTKGSQALVKQQLAQFAAKDPNRTVLLRADKEVPYGLVVSLMADIKEVGFDKLGMVTQPQVNKATR
ncbi:MAG: protein TolR [Desulfobulbaceae bacterium]|nr:protein TolR [Desulfobulbaceae bacterium]HIJ77826.1 protein TolR [Deltaproteobacteria bacterium]